MLKTNALRPTVASVILALLGYVIRALENEIRPVSGVRHPSVASIISEHIAWLSVTF